MRTFRTATRNNFDDKLAWNFWGCPFASYVIRGETPSHVMTFCIGSYIEDDHHERRSQRGIMTC